MSEKESLMSLIYKAGDLAHKWPTDNFTSTLADYLLDNGVILPPVKVGDKVYQLDAAGDIYESEVKQVIYNTKGISFDERSIGRTVFLTREDAESALEKLKGGGG